MTNYVRKMLNDAQAAGFTFAVDGGGDEDDYNGEHPAGAYEAIDAVDEASIILRDDEGNTIGYALIVNGLDEDERIADCSGWVDQWINANISL